MTFPTDAKIRFVGGPWHNRLVETRLLCHIDVIEAEPVKLSFNPIDLIVAKPSHKISTYFLHRFYAGTRDIPYFQYVHESLIDKGHPAHCTYNEDLPTRLPDEIFNAFAREAVALICKYRVHRPIPFLLAQIVTDDASDP